MRFWSSRWRPFAPLADDPHGFADRVVRLPEDSEAAAQMAERARGEVEANWDMGAITRKLADGYRDLLERKCYRM